jgi:aspartyl-tRNA(Asn)/glutamyl-tRNA(Gln) amidotransferase subunit A
MVRDFEKAYQQVDVIFAPSNGIEANLVQEDLLTDTVPVRQVPAGSITIWEILWRMPSPANLAGVPAFAMPCGFSASGLPLGMQIMGRHFEETTVYQVAAAYEGATEWHKRRPEFLGKA